MSYYSNWASLRDELRDDLTAHYSVRDLRSSLAAIGKSRVRSVAAQSLPFLRRYIASSPSKRLTMLSKMDDGERLSTRFLAWQIADLAVRQQDILPAAARGKGYRETLGEVADAALQRWMLPFPQWPFGKPDPFEE
ncbi:MAG: hypothetical protein WDN08_05510 [Rhizomicrobium sp.]